MTNDERIQGLKEANARIVDEAFLEEHPLLLNIVMGAKGDKFNSAIGIIAKEDEDIVQAIVAMLEEEPHINKLFQRAIRNVMLNEIIRTGTVNINSMLGLQDDKE